MGAVQWLSDMGIAHSRVALKGPGSKAQGDSPGKGVTSDYSPLRAAQPVSPLQGLKQLCDSFPRAYALGFAMSPLWGSLPLDSL